MHAWHEPAGWPPLARGEVHVWLAHLPDARIVLSDCQAILSSDERERIAKFRTEPLRERGQHTRGLLRQLLARYLGTRPAELAFTYNAHGKPAVAGMLHFNTSHSGDYVAFAFTHAGEVGIDIEQWRPEMERREAIAGRYFAAGERAALASVPEPERVRAFFDLWTRKEAFVKARGTGLFSGLDQFEVSLAEPRVVSVTNDSAARWWMTALPEVPGYSGALVVEAAECAPRFFRWTPATAC
jgi:4'-phosphopantetheinyl transferase